ncbi:MAG: cytochrome c [Myxococcota bacterium]|nr:cytochrome c [Myxococcota bacterium]
MQIFGILILFSCEETTVELEYGNYEPAHEEETRPTENEAATVVGDADVGNGEHIHNQSCLSCHPQTAPPFENLIPRVTDFEIETAIRDGKKGVPAALGERSPPDGALKLNLNDQDIIDVIAYSRIAYGEYEP